MLTPVVESVGDRSSESRTMTTPRRRSMPAVTTRHSGHLPRLTATLKYYTWGDGRRRGHSTQCVGWRVIVLTFNTRIDVYV